VLSFFSAIKQSEKFTEFECCIKSVEEIITRNWRVPERSMRRAGESLRTIDSPRPQRLFNRVILEGKKRAIGRIKTTIFILHELSFGFRTKLNHEILIGLI